MTPLVTVGGIGVAALLTFLLASRDRDSATPAQPPTPVESSASRLQRTEKLRKRMRKALLEQFPRIPNSDGEAWIAGHRDPTYRQLEKDPDAFKGERVKFRGKIFNIRESSGITSMQMYVGRSYFGYTENNLMAFFPRRTPLVRGNVVTIYGVVRGAHSYLSQAGWRITVPAINVGLINYSR